MTTTTPQRRRRPSKLVLLLILAAALLLALLASITVTVTTLQQAGRERAAALVTRDRLNANLDEMYATLKACRSAYTEQASVTAALRDVTIDSLDELGDYASSLFTTTLDSDPLVERIQAINTRELAIDTTACDD